MGWMFLLMGLGTAGAFAVNPLGGFIVGTIQVLGAYEFSRVASQVLRKHGG